MENGIFDDKRALALLSRVGEDLSGLRQDVGRLVQHAGKRTLPDAVKSGRDYARDRIGQAGRVARDHPAGVSLGGALLLGAAAAGLYLLLKSDCCGGRFGEREDA